MATTVSEIAVGQVCLADGTVVDAELVVVAAGIRSETALARAAGLDVDRVVVVDDEMRASAPGIWAVGECAQHRGVVHGLWPPVANQVGMAVASLDGEPVPFAPSTAQATLKIAGLRAFTAGRSTARAGEDEVVHSDGRYERYAKLAIDGDRLVGAVLRGDTTAAGRLRQLIASGDPAPIDVLDRSDAMPRIDRPRGDPRRQDAVVYQCMTVSRERIEQAIDVCELAST